MHKNSTKVVYIQKTERGKGYSHLHEGHTKCRCGFNVNLLRNSKYLRCNNIVLSRCKGFVVLFNRPSCDTLITYINRQLSTDG